MKPKIGDKIILVNGAGKRTHNVTKVAQILGNEKEVWLVEDKYRVPFYIVRDDRGWVQVLI